MPRTKGKTAAKKVNEGWRIDVPFPNYTVRVPTDDPEEDFRLVNVKSTHVSGNSDGVWITDAGDGQSPFKLCPDPDFIEAVATALIGVAQKLKRKASPEDDN